jgi:glycosyltransferase involved in cell wall biosynthesis
MKNKKKIAVFIDWFLPGYKAGGPITSVSNLINTLKKNFDFFIITSDRDLNETKPYQNIQTNKWLKKNSYNIIYLSPSSQNLKTYKKIINKNHFDKIYINSLFSLKFAILPLIAAKKNYKNEDIILAPRGMLSQQAFAKKKFKKEIFIIISKIFGLFNGIIFHATNQNEKQNIQSFFPNNKIIISPNLPKFNPPPLQHKNKTKGKLSLVSIARISQEKNTLFALKILSQIKNYKIKFDLYGTIVEKDYWNKCKKIIENLPENINVEYLGPIKPYKVGKTFSEYHFAFMPSIGENFGHSIFEAMAAGCPVIISNNTPWKNLEQKEIGWDIDLSDTKKFIQTIIYCANMSEIEYNKISEKTANFAEKFAKNPDLIEKTKKLFIS